MKTQQWIDLLAQGAGPAPRAQVARRLVPAMLFGLLLSAALALALLGPVPPGLFATPTPWWKLAYGGLLALAAGWLTARLARPLARCSLPARSLLGILLTLALLAVLAWLQTPPAQRLPALLGSTWLWCPWRVCLLSVPALAAALWALRGLAPTRPRLAGAAAGVLAGAVGALGYALVCSEASATFVIAWYTAGIGLTGLAGAWLGPRVLRW